VEGKGLDKPDWTSTKKLPSFLESLIISRFSWIPSLWMDFLWDNIAVKIGEV